MSPPKQTFIRREDFLLLLREHGDAALRVAEMLSNIYYATCREIRYLGLAESTEEKLARFLLDLKPANSSKGPQAKAILTLTQEDIANMIGTSRETVSRVLAAFKTTSLDEMQGSTITISRKERLQGLVKI